MQFKRAKDFIIDKLKRELPPYLYYHSIEHVLDVYQSAENIAARENIGEDDLELLKIASLFHDAGFTNAPARHEEDSCRIANRYLPDFGYTPEQIERISGMIMATRLPQDPKNHLEQIICDADLDYLGRDDFFIIGNDLFKEFKHFGIVTNDVDWNRLQVKFLESHHYFTATAIKLRQQKKAAHLELVKQKLADVIDKNTTL